MPTLTNRIRAGGFIQSESNGFRSRDQITIHGGYTGAVALLPGTVLGKLTSGGRYVPSAATGSDGSETAFAILFDYVDPTGGDVIAAVISRDAEVRADDLTYDASVNDGTKQAAKVAQLADVGIIVRT
jgi:hypothetical protein